MLHLFRGKEDDIPRQGAVRALLAAAYIGLVTIVIGTLESSTSDDQLGLLMPVIVLLLLTLSAGVMAALVFGTPVMHYLDGKKREAVRLVGWTIGSLAAITAVVLLIALAA